MARSPKKSKTPQKKSPSKIKETHTQLLVPDSADDADHDDGRLSTATNDEIFSIAHKISSRLNKSDTNSVGSADLFTDNSEGVGSPSRRSGSLHPQTKIKKESFSPLPRSPLKVPRPLSPLPETPPKAKNSPLKQPTPSGKILKKTQTPQKAQQVGTSVTGAQESSSSGSSSESESSVVIPPSGSASKLKVKLWPPGSSPKRPQPSTSSTSHDVSSSEDSGSDAAPPTRQSPKKRSRSASSSSPKRPQPSTSSTSHDVSFSEDSGSDAAPPTRQSPKKRSRSASSSSPKRPQPSTSSTSHDVSFSEDSGSDAGPPTRQSPKKRSRSAKSSSSPKTPRPTTSSTPRNVNSSENSVDEGPSSTRRSSKKKSNQARRETVASGSGEDGEAAGADVDVIMTAGTASKMRFKCPPGFEESSGSCWLEDVLGKDVDLWQICVPTETQLEDLNGEEPLVDGSFVLKKEQKGELTYLWELDCVQEPKTEVNSRVIVLPSKKDKSMHYAGQVRGHITLTKSIQVPMLEDPPVVEKKRHQLPPGLKLRYRPFGADNPVASSKSSSKKDRRKSKSQEDCTDDAVDYTPKSKKKKKKHRKSIE